MEKTSCLLIGNRNEDHYVHDCGFKWVTEMKILGITFSENNRQITQINFEPKIIQIENEIAQWRRRALTTLGRVTVVKSLLMSKLVHLFSALPTPPPIELKRIQRLFFSFIWGGKRDPVKRTKLIQDYSHGGLRMVDVEAFAKSMKLTWLKRLLVTKSLWSQITATEMSITPELLCRGSKYLGKITSKITNPFWKDVLQAFASFVRIHSIDMPHLLSESLWFSDYTKFHCSIIRHWYSKGIRFIGDLFNENTGRLHTKESLEEAYDIKMTFLCYNSLIRSLPESVKSATIMKYAGPVIPHRLNLLMNNVNFSRLAYNILVEYKRHETDETNARLKQKWLRDTGFFEDNCFVALMKATNSTRIRIFQYKLFNRILATNKYLKMINIKDDECCTFCKGEPETLVHLFWNCPKIKTFISLIKTKILRPYRIELNIDIKTWFFPISLGAKELHIVTLGKMVIYEARNSDTSPHIMHLINKLKWVIEIECNAAQSPSQRSNFEKKWGSMKDMYLQGTQ